MKSRGEVVVISITGKRLQTDALRALLGRVGLEAVKDGTLSATDALIGLVERPERHVLLSFSEDGAA